MCCFDGQKNKSISKVLRLLWALWPSVQSVPLEESWPALTRADPKYRSSDDIHSQLSENRAKENQSEQEDGASYYAAVQAKQMEEAGECTGFHKQVKNGIKIKEKIPTLEEDIEGMRVSIL